MIGLGTYFLVGLFVGAYIIFFTSGLSERLKYFVVGLVLWPLILLALIAEMVTDWIEHRAG